MIGDPLDVSVLIAELRGKLAGTERRAEILAVALKEASAIARDSVDAIEALYVNLTNAIGEARPAMSQARAMIEKWEALAEGKVDTMTPGEAGIVIAALQAAFPRVVTPEETVRLYARFLVDIPLDVGVAAVARIIARGQSFPVIAVLRETCEAVAGNGPPDADQAFAEVMRGVSKWGAYGDPKWSHSAIREAVESITWREICFSEHPPSLRAHFDRAYVAAKKRTADPGHSIIVAGIVADVKQKLVGVAARKELKK